MLVQKTTNFCLSAEKSPGNEVGVLPSLIPPRRSPRSWIQMKVKSGSVIEMGYDYNYHFGGRVQIDLQRWPRFYIHVGP